ncbi:PilZ domain-containing protein [Paenibacillus sp. ACRRX]|uniref:flagellar brake protein n=1 Tax=unclassified Paenibacillus TaxID=185978 RepID=UPI001EF4C865|nr:MULTISPECIES: PilZ domain-containing protein [unclassified Paenibacillus]MCG7406423.1 PilZ domain-containing protein [Paenibacillus sp. ACRRX]MDK8179454.1 PilZ domain-containing protein [Paenibacillus sp. UMB4589-SE434]
MSLRVNDTVYILPSSAGTDEQEYRARVTEIDDYSIWIEIPLQEGTGQFARFSLGEQLDVTYVQLDGVRCNFITKMVGNRHESIRMLALVKPQPDQITRTQRRSYLRVQAALEMAVRTAEGVQKVARTEDISGGGVSFIAELQWGLEEGQLLDCWLVIPPKAGDVDHISFTASTVRIEPRGDKHCLIMMQFDRITDVERQKIIRYCFERQLEMRKQ